MVIATTTPGALNVENQRSIAASSFATVAGGKAAGDGVGAGRDARFAHPVAMTAASPAAQFTNARFIDRSASFSAGRAGSRDASLFVTTNAEPWLIGAMIQLDGGEFVMGSDDFYPEERP